MTIYIIFDCNQWKSRDSMRFLATADEKNLDSILATIQRDKEYTPQDMETYIYIEETTLNTIY
jgi:hypothetical protein